MFLLILWGELVQMLKIVGKFFFLGVALGASVFASISRASSTLEESILVSSAYLESGMTHPMGSVGLTVGVESPITFIPSEDSLGPYATRRPPVASVPGIRLGYGFEHSSGFVWEGALGLGMMRLNEDPFGKVKNFKFAASRVGLGVGASKQFDEVRMLLSFSSQWNENRIRGGLIDDEIVSLLDTTSKTTGWGLEGQYRGFILGVSTLSRKGTADFKIFDQGTSIVVDQDGSLPLRTWALGYGGESFRITLERTILSEVTSFYQLNYRHIWTIDI
jgi:hypothetical protein